MENMENMENNEYVVGIDLGTTNSCVSIWRNNNLEIIPDEYGNRTIPSFVAYTNIHRYVGSDAKNQTEINPENVFFEIKRLIGRKFDDPIVSREQQFLSYKINKDENDNIKLSSTINNNKIFSPEEIQAAILSKLKQMATLYLKSTITKAVITIPAYFNDGQRQATKDAASIAGIEVVRMINEPTAAGLAYGLMTKSISKNNDNSIKKLTYIVYDFGGGTLDVTLLCVENGIFEVLCSSGNTRLGGSDFETRLVSFSIAKFEKQYQVNITDKISCLSLQKLRQSCEQAKKILSTNTKTHIAVKNFYNNKDLFYYITRSEFEQLCGDLFILCIKPINDILYECEISESDIDEIIMVGGMTRIPKIRNLIKNRFNKEPNCSINPEEAVAAGAAIQAFIITHVSDPFSESVTVLDTTSLSLGVETNDGIMDIIIPKKSIIPVEQSKYYTTSEDYSTSVTIKIFEGERTMTCDNFFVGEFELNGIESVPRGVPEILVSFKYDSNGIITVTAENSKTKDNNDNTDFTSGISTLIITSNKGRLSKLEIDNLIAEAKELEMRDEFEKRKKLYYYEIDDFCNNILTNLKRKEFKLTDNDKVAISNDIEQVLLWLKQKKYNEYEDEEYEQVLTKIKKRYGVLILKGSTDDTLGSVEENTDLKTTTIYGDDEEIEKEQIFKNIETEEIGAFGMAEPEKAELKELKQSLTDLCYSIFEIISSENLNLSKNHSNELKDYIDDTLLWLHVHQKPTKNEFKIKIDQVNETCNTIMNHYTSEKTEIFKASELIQSIKNSRDELENLCFVIKLMIQDKVFPIKKNIIDKLDSEVQDILDWITEHDSAFLNNATLNIDEFHSECKTKLLSLNTYCDTLHVQMNGINIDEHSIVENKIILSGPQEVQDSDNTPMGTSIISIVREKQKEIFINLLNDTQELEMETNLEIEK